MTQTPTEKMLALPEQYSRRFFRDIYQLIFVIITVCK
jgi:hypothetical protein